MKLFRWLAEDEERLSTIFGLWFVLGIGMAGVALFLDDFLPAFDSFLNEHMWVLFLLCLPIAAFLLFAVILFILGIMSFLLESYHRLREEGQTPTHSLLATLSLIFLVALVFFINVYFGGGGKYLDY